MTENQVVVFEVYRHTYAIPIHQVKEIIRYEEAVKLPNMPDYLEGIISLRGRVLPVVDLARRCGFPSRDAVNRKALIVEVNGQTTGLVVDEVSSVTKLGPVQEGSVEMPVNLASSRYVRGIGRRNGALLILLELEQLVDFAIMAKITLPEAI